VVQSATLHSQRSKKGRPRFAANVEEVVMRITLAGLMVSLLLCAGGVQAQFAGVLTQHNDLARTGQNLSETILTPSNVKPKTFGKLFSYPVDNQVYAQPLYVPNVAIAGMGTRNVLYVATEGDTLFAFDADGLSPYVLWSVNFTDPANGVTTINCTLTGLQCNVFPTTGITGTPVIDPVTGTIYVVVRTAETNAGKTQYLARLHALDITSGAEKFGGPVSITGSVPGTGTGSKKGVVAFDTLHDNHRPGLVLANGNIYIGWAGSGHGWITAYNATTLKQVGIFNSTPNGTLGGLWASGNAFAVDTNGNIYVATGDGTFDANTGGLDYGDSVIQFSPTLQVLQYFTPKDQLCRAQMANDWDLGSGGPMLLPPQAGAATNELIVAGKGGQGDIAGVTCYVDSFSDGTFAPIYMLNPDSLGGYEEGAGDTDANLQTIQGSPRGYWSSPAYWQGPSGNYVYYSGMGTETGVGDSLRQYSVTKGVLSPTSIANSSNVLPVGSTPSISANGTSNGIVWTIERRDINAAAPGIHTALLYAYNATDVGTMLYNSGQTKVDGQYRDQTGCGNKFAVPTIANGKVYVATQNEIDVFGLLPTNLTTPAPSVSNPCFNFVNIPVGTTSAAQSTTLTNLGPGTLTISGIGLKGVNTSVFTEKNTCPQSLAPGAACTITITFTPTVSKIPQQAYVRINDNAIGGALTLEMTGTGQ
jgi:hypothetical protein